MTNELMTESEFLSNLPNPLWRMSNLYKIMIKGTGDDSNSNLVVTLKPNRAQLDFISNLHYRNIILKARQLGFSTIVDIMLLDYALFNDNVRCGIVAHDLGAAEAIFRDKVKFAYDNLPDILKMQIPLERDSASELLFSHNNSSIRVATSMRSGTYQRLHVSEFGKICARYPERAKEVITGSIPSVPSNGIVIIESTAEGKGGYFYDMTQRSMSLKQLNKPLNEKDYRFHFYPWWQETGYRMSDTDVIITAEDNEYFAQIESKCGCVIDKNQRAWYVATRDTDFSGNSENMWQEYPSFPDEAFQVSNAGCYYSKQMVSVRKQGRILRIPDAPSVPVNTFWDIGNSDGCAIWLHQKIGMENRMIDYHEAHGESLTYYVRYLQNEGHIYNKHFLPHDAGHKRLSDKNKSVAEMLKDLGLKNIVIVPRISDINAGIQQVRNNLSSCWFDERACKLGIQRLDGYHKSWNEKDAVWSNSPAHDENSEGADAFRQWAQAQELGLITLSGSTQHDPYVPSWEPMDAEMGV